MILLSWTAIASLAISVIANVEVSMTSGPSSLGSCCKNSVGAVAAKRLHTGRGFMPTSGSGISVHGEVESVISAGWALSSNTSGASCAHSTFGIWALGSGCNTTVPLKRSAWLSGIGLLAP